MPQLEELQSKNNALAVSVLAVSVCIKNAIECTDPYEVAECMHKIIDAFDATVSAFEDFGNEAAKIIESQMKDIYGGF